MSLVTINCYTNEYSSITNGLRASIYLQSSPSSVVSSITELNPPHNARTWSFAGLIRDNYIFRLDEIDSGGTVIQNLAEIFLVPTELSGDNYLADTQVIVGTTPNFVSGVSSATFDGSNSSPDFRSWTVTVDEMNGRGILEKDVDFTFDSTTGTFTLLSGLFLSGAYYNFHFDPQKVPVGTGVAQSVAQFKINLLTSNTSLDSSYLGSTVIVEPSSTVPVTITLPPLSAIADGIPISFEVGGSNVTCVKIIADGSDAINFAAPKNSANYILVLTGESLTMYKYTRGSGATEWRVKDAFGNFTRVGEIISSDQVTSGMIDNVAQLLGDIVTIASKYYRLYDYLFNNINQSQLRAFEDTITSSNAAKFSKKDVSSGTEFYLANRGSLYQRASDGSILAGVYKPNAMLQHQHISPIAVGSGSAPFRKNTVPITNARNASGIDNTYSALDSTPTDENGDYLSNVDTETRPETFYSNLYIII